jgi:hypothetical protein
MAPQLLFRQEKRVMEVQTPMTVTILGPLVWRVRLETKWVDITENLQMEQKTKMSFSLLFAETAAWESLDIKYQRERLVFFHRRRRRSQ